MEQLLYIVWNPSPVIFNIGGFPVRWYAICWIIGIVLGYLVMRQLFKEQKMKEELLTSLFFYIFFGVLIGARLGQCFFYEPNYFFSSVHHVIEIVLPIQFLDNGGWQYTGYQGLASYGGVIGILVAIWLFCRKTKVSGWVVLDNMGVCAGITACFIRLGNLMNSEIIGKVTDVPWAFIFEKVDNNPRHPGQLYEAIAYLCIFLLIFFIYKKRGPQSIGHGFYVGLCLTLVFTFRFLIEYTKEVQESFEIGLPLDMGQVLSIPLVAFGIYCLLRKKKQNG